MTDDQEDQIIALAERVVRLIAEESPDDRTCHAIVAGLVAAKIVGETGLQIGTDAMEKASRAFMITYENTLPVFYSGNDAHPGTETVN